MGWSTRNLTDTFHAPRAFSGPVAYAFAAEQTRHVVYLERNDAGASSGRVVELYCGTDDVWHYKDATGEAEAPLATSAPSAYVFDTEGSQHIVFLAGADGHIHELYQDDGWHHNDLMDAASTVARAVDPPQGWASSHYRTQHVTFRDEYRRVHLLTRGTGDDAAWSHRMLAHPGIPTAATAPAGYAFDAAGTQHIHFVGDDQLLYEIVMDGGDWGIPHDLGPNVGASRDPLPHPTGYGFAGDGSRHLPWHGGDGHIHELSNAAGTWSRLDLTDDRDAPPPADGTAPAGYAYEANPQAPVGTRHVVYTDTAGVIQEFWHDPGGWHVNPLTGAPGAPTAASAPTAFADAATQNVFYLAAGGDIVELRYTPGRVLGTVHGTVHGSHRL